MSKIILNTDDEATIASVASSSFEVITVRKIPHLSDIDSLNVAMLDAEDDVIMVGKPVIFAQSAWSETLVKSKKDNWGIVGQQASIARDANLSEDELAFASSLYLMNGIYPAPEQPFYYCSNDVVLFSQKVIELTRGFDPDLGATPEGIADIGIKAFFQLGLYTALINEVLVLPQKVDEVNFQILAKKYKVNGSSLFEVAKTIVSRKILAH
jgi:hypothetical protein